MKINELFENIREMLYKKNDISEEEIVEIINVEIMKEPEISNLVNMKKREIAVDIFNRLKRFGFLQKYLDDEDVSEIMVNGTKNIFIEKRGEILKIEEIIIEKDLVDIIQSMVSKVDRMVNKKHPIVDARLPCGSRLNVVMNPVALNGPIITIRKFKKELNTLSKLLELGSLNDKSYEYLKNAVIGRKNIFICGGTSSGKTTLLNCLASEIETSERVITIEDSAELSIENVVNIVKLETRNSSYDGTGEISMSDLIKTSLRMRPDRIIVGETRSFEAFDMLQAMNTGHDGSMSTGHSNSCYDMLYRLETMVLSAGSQNLSSIKKQISSGVDILLYIKKSAGGKREVVEIMELEGIQDEEYVFKMVDFKQH